MVKNNMDSTVLARLAENRIHNGDNCPAPAQIMQSLFSNSNVQIYS